MVSQISYITTTRQRRFVAVCGHRPKYFFALPQNSAGRFICMGDNDLALRGVYGALSGRFRVFYKPLPGLGLRPSGAFGALFFQKVYLYRNRF